MNPLKNKLENIIRISTDYDFEDIIKLSGDIIKNLEKESYIEIFVCGRFKSGKSSFINSILNESILPTGVIPVTGVITNISYSEKEEFTVCFNDGSSQKIYRSELYDYITEEKNPSNIKNVEYVDIKIPFDKDFKEIKFIDTPGFEYSSVHSDITSSVISGVELGIVCISFDSPLSENDIKLINKLKKHTPTISLVITKVDLITLDDRKKVIDFIKNKLNDIKIFEYSIKENLARENLIKNLLVPVIKNKSDFKARIMAYKVNSIENYLISCLQTLISIKTKEKNELDRFKEEFSKLLLRFEDFKKDIKAIVLNDYFHIREEILKIFLNHANIHKEFKKEIYDKLYNSSDLFDMSQNYEKTFKTMLSKKISDIYEIEKGKIIKILEKENLKIYNMSEDFIKTILTEANKILNTDIRFLPIEKPEIRLNIPKLKIFSAFDIHIELLWFLIPTFIPQFKKYIIRKIIKNIEFEVEKNLTRTAMEISESLKNNIEENCKSMTADIDYRFKTIKNLYSSRDLNTDKIEKEINSLEQRDKTRS